MTKSTSQLVAEGEGKTIPTKEETIQAFRSYMLKEKEIEKELFRQENEFMMKSYDERFAKSQPLPQPPIEWQEKIEPYYLWDYNGRKVEGFFKAGESGKCPEQIIEVRTDILESFIQSQIDASYKRGVEETLDRVIEKVNEKISDADYCSEKNSYEDGKEDGWNDCLFNVKKVLDQLNQTHREELK